MKTATTMQLIKVTKAKDMGTFMHFTHPDGKRKCGICVDEIPVLLSLAKAILRVKNPTAAPNK